MKVYGIYHYRGEEALAKALAQAGMTPPAKLPEGSDPRDLKPIEVSIEDVSSLMEDSDVMLVRRAGGNYIHLDLRGFKFTQR